MIFFFLFFSFFLLLKKVEAKIQGYHRMCLNSHMGMLINALKRGHWMHLLLHVLRKKTTTMKRMTMKELSPFDIRATIC